MQVHLDKAERKKRNILVPQRPCFISHYELLQSVHPSKAHPGAKQILLLSILVLSGSSTARTPYRLQWNAGFNFAIINTLYKCFQPEALTSSFYTNAKVTWYLYWTIFLKNHIRKVSRLHVCNPEPHGLFPVHLFMWPKKLQITDQNFKILFYNNFLLLNTPAFHRSENIQNTNAKKKEL